MSMQADLTIRPAAAGDEEGIGTFDDYDKVRPLMAKILICVLSVLIIVPFASAQSPDPAVEQRVDRLLNQLTSEEKLQLLGGVNDFYTRPIPRLGIPSLKMSDGPVGTRNDGQSTAYPAGAALAATWDIAVAHREGVSLGRDARARGDHILLGPAVNIYREPQCGRNYEYFGEDPYLAGQIAAGYVQGVQSQGVGACVKHYACNNQETQRDSIDAIVDERTLHEIYLPAFEAAVKQGRVRAVMSAYNQVNDQFMSANHYLLTDVLKRDWGFDGLVMSDWGGTHDALGPANAGLDLEMPSGDNLNPQNLSPLIGQGRIAQATIDDKVRRLLRLMIVMGWMDHSQKNPSINWDDPQSNQTALAVAREGIVLLKNQSNLLPLNPATMHSVLLMGPNAGRYVCGDGSSQVRPNHFATIAYGVRAGLSNTVKIKVAPYPDPFVQMTALVRSCKYESPGLRAEFYNNKELSGPPALTRLDAQIDDNWHTNLPMPQITSHAFSARWTGKIRPDASGQYVIAVCSDDGSRVLLDGKAIINDWSDHQARVRSTTLALVAGKTYDLTVEYYNSAGEASIQFGWGPVPPAIAAQDRAEVAGADAVIVCVGTSDSEASDRSYSLENDQQQLIESSAALNPKTIVVLNSGGNVAMRDWIDRVPALLDAWYPGQAGGQAIAEIIFGDVNPSGRLPDTFEKDWPDAPAFANYPGADGKVVYGEGIYVGYRWFDKKQIEPRFCFGYGLSYTTFSIGQLKIKPNGKDDSQAFDVGADVSNTGQRPGAEVVQLYVRPPAGGPDRPPQELKAFTRVQLNPGQTARVTMRLDSRSFAYWDVTSHTWKVIPGQYEIAIGRSSRDIAQTAKLTLR
jgi:beta-glucosidase